MHGLTTPPPNSQKQEGSTYCAMNKCYTPTEFAMFGIGAIVMGTMLGVIGISWFKHQVSYKIKPSKLKKGQLCLMYNCLRKNHYEFSFFFYASQYLFLYATIQIITARDKDF